MASASAPRLREPWEEDLNPWENEDLYNGGWGEDSDNEPENDIPLHQRRRAVDPTKAESEEHLGEYLISRVLLGKMAAKEACTIAYWSKFCGVGGVVADLALRPDSPTGHFKRRFDEVIGAKTFGGKTMDLDIPGHLTASMGRVVHKASFVYNAKLTNTTRRVGCFN